MFRKVVNTDTNKPACNLCGPDAFGITDTLECGHTVHRKGSGGFAAKRQCRDCDHLKGGGYQRIGNVEESWDDKNQMPVFREL